MGNITLVGRLQDYAGKAIDSFYKTADKIASPILDTIASIDFAGSYFNNSSIPEYAKFQALRRNFLRDESAIAQIGGEFPAQGKKMESGWKDFWKILAAAGVVSAAGAGYAYMKKKDFGFDDIDSGIAYAKAKIFGAALFAGNPPAATDNPIANESAVAAPQVSETPNYDYYDEEFKVGIKIEGDQQFKRNVTNMLNTMKEVTPNRYAEVIPYAPKKIVRSIHNNNFNGNNLIGLHKLTEQLGGSNDSKSRLFGTAYLYTEMRGRKADKTGELEKLVTNLNRSEANYKVEMFQNEGLVEYLVENGIWKQSQADAYLRQMSDELKSGEYNKKYN